MNYNSLLGSKLAKYFNKKYGIITYSGTLAIEVALKSLRLKRKSKVLISSNVCYSIINTVLKLELVPVIKMPNNGLFFTNDDIDVVIDKEIIDCILLVHQFGILNNISKRKYKNLNIKIIEDVAQAWDLKDNNGINNIGIDSDIVVTSFGITKPISYGIGGGLFFDNEKIFKEIDFCDNESREKQGIILSYAYPLCKEIKLDYLLEKANEIVDEQRLCAREYSNVLLNQKTIKYINYEQNSGNVWHRFPMWIENQKTFEKIKKILEKSTLEFQFEHDVKLTDLPMCQKCIKYNENTHYYFILVRTRNVNIENQVKNLKKLIDLLKND